MRDRLQRVSADVTGSLILLGRLGGQRDVQDGFDLGEGTFRELALGHLVDRRFGQVVADQILAREAMGVEMVLNRRRDCQPPGLGFKRCLMFRHGRASYTSQRLTFFRKFWREPAGRAGRGPKIDSASHSLRSRAAVQKNISRLRGKQTARSIKPPTPWLPRTPQQPPMRP